MSQGFEVILKWSLPVSSSGNHHKTPEYHIHFSKTSLRDAVALSSSVTLTTGGAQLVVNDHRLVAAPATQPAISEPEDVEMLDVDTVGAGPVAGKVETR